MEICPECGHIAYYDPYFNAIMCTSCNYMEKRKPTNADYIRSLTDKELCKELLKRCSQGCPEHWCTHYLDHTSCEDCWLEWLQKPHIEETK